MIAIAVFLSVLAICTTLVVRWALEFTKIAVSSDVPSEEDPDPSIDSVSHFDEYDELVFNGRRYRKYRHAHKLYSYESIGFLHYPEGTVPRKWLPLNDEYERRLRAENTAKVEDLARSEWRRSSSKQVSEPEQQVSNRSATESSSKSYQQRERDLDALVENARKAGEEK